MTAPSLARTIYASIALAAVMLFSESIYASEDISHLVHAQGCQTNCVRIVNFRNRFTLVALGNNGEAFRIEQLAIPANAKPDQANWASSENTVSASGEDEATQRVYYQTYTSPAGTWVVVTLITYDAEGNITDVQSTTTFFPKDQVK
ncbi:MAG: hypothetical protein R3270_04905 [Gammaproteobacteria bacterium]|nr:hypothetical protein [Gammaproteobacteria bacterium]